MSYQLSFCKVCQKKKNSYSDGILCSITNRKPDFNNECIHYDIDKRAIKNASERIIRQINKKYSNGKLMNFLKSQTYISEKELQKSSFTNFNQNKTYNISEIQKWFSLIILFLVVLYSSNKIFFEKIINNVMIGILVISIIFFIGLLISYFALEQEKIIVNEKFVKINSTKFFWNDILHVSLHIKNYNGPNTYTCLIGTNTGVLLEFDLSNFNEPVTISRHIAKRKNVLQQGL